MKRPSIVEDWRWITTRSWSWWANNLAGVFSALEAVVQFAPDSWVAFVGKGTWAVLAGLVIFISNGLRLLKQRRPE